MNEPHASFGATAATGSSEPATVRLVIRARIIPEETHETVTPHSYGRAPALVAAGVAGLLVLSWIGINAFRIDSPPTPIADAGARKVESPAPSPASVRHEAVPAVGGEPPLATTTASSGVAPVEAVSSAVKSVQLPATKSAQVSASTASPIQEVIPSVPRSALDTIRGTVRVSVRVTINEQGAVVAASADDPGPSRYFERLALEASRKWTFTPARMQEPRTMLLRFNFTRDGASARAAPLQ